LHKGTPCAHTQPIHKTKRDIMKKLTLAAVVSALTAPAFAGGLAEPMVEAPVVAAATSSSAGILVPLILIVLIAGAVLLARPGGPSFT
jgi:cytochrome c biogenesis factor